MPVGTALTSRDANILAFWLLALFVYFGDCNPLFNKPSHLRTDPNAYLSGLKTTEHRDVVTEIQDILISQNYSVDSFTYLTIYQKLAEAFGNCQPEVANAKSVSESRIATLWDRFDFLTPEQWISLGCAVGCVVCAASAAGLTLGLMSMDPLELAIKQRTGNPQEKERAERILPVIKRHHLLLVTLLLFNSLANEALPIFLNRLVPEYISVLLSVTMVLIFGEIIPSAIFTGPQKLAIIANCIWFVYALMGIFLVIAWPLSYLLDLILGHEELKLYSRTEISALVQLQKRSRMRSTSRPTINDDDMLQSSVHSTLHSLYGEEEEEELEDTGLDLGLSADEIHIMTGAIRAHSSTVADCMVPMDKVYGLSMDDRLDLNRMAEIMAHGFSRLPVYKDEITNIRGFLLVKRLVVLNPRDELPVNSLTLFTPICVSPDLPLLKLLNLFQESKSHIAIVTNAPNITAQELVTGVALSGISLPQGIVTLEDVIGEIIQEQVLEEPAGLEIKANQIMQDYIRKQNIKKSKKDGGMGKRRDSAPKLNPRMGGPPRDSERKGGSPKDIEHKTTGSSSIRNSRSQPDITTPLLHEQDRKKGYSDV